MFTIYIIYYVLQTYYGGDVLFPRKMHKFMFRVLYPMHLKHKKAHHELPKQTVPLQTAAKPWCG
jgi:hypothetical protein